MKIATALVLISVLVAGSISSADCAVMCTAVHPVRVRNEQRPQSASTAQRHDHAAWHHEHGISQSKTNVAAGHGVSCNPDCKTWLKLSARRNVRKVTFKNSELGLPKSTTFEQSIMAASARAGTSFSSAPPAKHSSSVLRV